MKLAVVVLALVVACSMVEAKPIEKRQDALLGFFNQALAQARDFYEKAQEKVNNWWQSEGISRIRSRVKGAFKNLSNRDLAVVADKARNVLATAADRLNLKALAAKLRNVLPAQDQDIDDEELEEIVQAVSDVEDEVDAPADVDNEVVQKRLFESFSGAYDWIYEKAAKAKKQAAAWWKSEGVANVRSKVRGAAKKLSDLELGEIVGKARQVLRGVVDRLNVKDVVQRLRNILPKQEQDLDENELEDIVSAVSTVEDEDDTPAYL